MQHLESTEPRVSKRTHLFSGPLTRDTSRLLRLQVLKRLLSRVVNKIAFVAPGGDSARPWLHRLRGMKVGKNVWIGQFVYIDELHPEDVTIGDNCTIGLRTSIFSHFYWGARRPASNGKVTIEKDVFIGPHCVILPNVHIGEGAVIKAGTVVSRNVPAHTFWGSPSAQVLGEAAVPLTAGHTYQEFLRGVRPRRAGMPSAHSGSDASGTAEV